MKEHPDKNFGIAHLGLDFWRKVVDENPYSYKRNDVLLCVADDGRVLCHQFLPSSELRIYECASQSQAMGCSTLIRIQEHPRDLKDPFQIDSYTTRSLYKAAYHYEMQLAEVVWLSPEKIRPILNL